MELLFSPGIPAFFLQLLCCPQFPSPAMYFSAHWSLTHPSNPLQFLPLPTSVRPLRPHSQELVSSLHTGYFISFLSEIFVLCYLLGHLPDCFSIRSKHLECPIKLSGQSFISWVPEVIYWDWSQPYNASFENFHPGRWDWTQLFLLLVVSSTFYTGGWITLCSLTDNSTFPQKEQEYLHGAVIAILSCVLIIIS